MSQEYRLGSLEEARPDNSKYGSVLEYLESSGTKVSDGGLEYEIDGCDCMSCGCFKSPWTVVLSPAGIAAGMAAFSAASLMDL